MGSIADKLIYLNGTKTAIKNAIEAKGVTVNPEDTFRDYATRIEEIPAGSVYDWPRPADWPDISEVNDNEINLLIGDFGLATIAFVVTTQGAVQYTVNWGDGNTENFASGATAQHTYEVGTGQACSLGYTTFQAVVSCSTGNILTWKTVVHNLSNPGQITPLLEFVSGASNMTDCSQMFAGFNVDCPHLIAVVFPSVMNNINSLYSTCKNCWSLIYLKLPDSAPLLTNVSYITSYCYSLHSLILPIDAINITNMSYMAQYCGLFEFVFPVSCNNVTDITEFLRNCKNLTLLSLPNLLNVTSAINAFASCTLIQLVNVENLGKTTSSVSMTWFTHSCEMIESLVINAFLSKIGVQGDSGAINKLSTFRLLNPNSTFTGSSPQIDCSYCSLGQAALVTLFGDLPTLVGKTINITGCTGAAALTPEERAIATDKGWTITG